MLNIRMKERGTLEQFRELQAKQTLLDGDGNGEKGMDRK